MIVYIRNDNKKAFGKSIFLPIQVDHHIRCIIKAFLIENLCFHVLTRSSKHCIENSHTNKLE